MSEEWSWQIHAKVILVRPRHLEVQESLGARLAADINSVVRVGEAIELSGGALGVGSHVLKVEPIANIEDALEASALADEVNAITSRTPDRILDTVVS